MFKKLISIVLSCSVVCGVQIPVFAGEIFNQIQNTGVIKAGFRQDTPPFAFIDDKGKPVGYSLDILELVRQETERRLGKPVKLDLIVVDPDTRFDKIKDGSIHIECGSTTVTWEREKIVDFGVSYFASGTQMIVHRGSEFAHKNNLQGAKIGVIPNTTNEKAMRLFAKDAQLIFVASEEEGMEKLTKKEIDGFAGDGILLQNLKKQANNSQQYEIVPEFPYMIESYACTIPENDSAWRTTVNYSLVKFMQGVVTDTPSAIDIYDRWFGINGNTPYPVETIADYFQGIINGYEWINIEERY